MLTKSSNNDKNNDSIEIINNHKPLLFFSFLFYGKKLPGTLVVKLFETKTQAMIIITQININ